ncbi:9690_t:CDS:2 [Acaulospora morrowiae]|uniref:Kynureninase n=1 Tax=Acaulospora morrowiae TaxID=94023 RepID=A0A9N9CE89_9GLOM|nr:9690_t:CDS:2 [Acaulospora morrowiae]
MWDLVAPLFKEFHEELTDELKYQKLKREIKNSHDLIERLAAKAKLDPLSVEFSKHLDEHDRLKPLREEFSIPKSKDVVTEGTSKTKPNEEVVYFCGNSLGLMPKRVRQLLSQELDVWATAGVVGHFNHKFDRPWISIDEAVVEKTAEIVGAKPIEIAIMNTLTSNLHLLMASFYTPTKSRNKILIEAKAFPSDQYAVESQIKFHGYDPATALIKVNPPPGEYLTKLDDILDTIEKEGNKIALLLFSAVHYYTGQFFKIKKITAAAQKKGIVVGFDLSHAVGNVVLRLHKWKVDFASWCSYKYLNSGPGGIAGIFIHEKHANDFNRPRFAGWWGSDRRSRFQMDKPFQPTPGAGGFQVSNPSVLNTVSLLGSLEVFEKTSMVQLRAKSILLTGYLEYLLDKQLNNLGYKIITPRDPHQRGCQISLFFEKEKFEKVYKDLLIYGIIIDERNSDVIRVAPNPMYNSFSEVFRFVEALKTIMADLGVKPFISTASSGGKHKGTMTFAKVAFSVIGIYSCFLTWAVLQERVSTTPYYDNKESKPQRFRYFIFLNMVQSITASFIAFLYIMFVGKKIEVGSVSSSMLFRLLQVSFFGAIGSPFGYESLKHIDYPTLVLGKSCKLIPVMLVNIILYQRKFPLYKYVVVTLITLGVSCFMLLQPVSEKKKAVASSSFYGLMLLSINLLIDGVTNSTQDQIFHKYKVSGQQMMFFMNMFSALLMFTWLINPWNSELNDALVFCQIFPSVLKDILLFSLCGALGQCFIFYTLQNFGSLFLVTITVTRKFFTILLSIFWFNHQLNWGQWLAVGLVFSGIGLEAIVKQLDSIKLKEKKIMSDGAKPLEENKTGRGENGAVSRAKME